MAIKGTVSLEGIEFFARHGVYDFEHEKGNIFIVDIFLTRHYGAGELYNLENTFDYEKVYALADEVMQEPELLLETVAHKIKKSIITHFDTVEWLKIKIRKTNPPIKNAKINHSGFELVWEGDSKRQD